jgi:hypothetical protein
MPATYEPLATTNITAGTSVISYQSLSSAYTDFILVASNVTGSVAGTTLYLRFNNDSGANYSNTELYGNGTTAASSKNTGFTVIPMMYFITQGTLQTGQIAIAQILNYSNTSVYKTVIVRENNAADPNYPGTGAIVGLWRNTAAINRIDISNNGYTFNGGTLTLYGIKAA